MGEQFLTFDALNCLRLQGETRFLDDLSKDLNYPPKGAASLPGTPELSALLGVCLMTLFAAHSHC